MTAVRRGRPAGPLAVVAATDLLLVALLAGPWAVHWVSSAEPYGLLSDVVVPLVLPAWEQEPGIFNHYAVTLYMERWRVGTWVRIVVFLLLHLWVVNRLIRGSTDEGPWRAARAGAWVLAPVAGALSGLATLVPAAFDLSVTVEERANLRTAGIVAFEDGAHWGLVAGAACWVTLTVARVAARDAGGRAVDDEQTFTVGQVRRLLGHALLGATVGVAAGGALLAVFGRPLLAPGHPTPTAHLAETMWTELVSHVHWSTPRYNAAPALASWVIAFGPVVAYITALFTLLTLSGIAARHAPPPRRFVSGWHAVTWAILLYTLTEAWYATVTGTAVDGASGTMDSLAQSFIHGLSPAAAYTAVLGWVPALAALVASIPFRPERNRENDSSRRPAVSR